MARFDNDPFPGTDYSSYKSWNTVTTPDGGVYYEVPGRPEYVYDEVASNATGRKVFRRNPKQQITAQEEENERIRKQQEQQAFNQSPAGQLIPVAAGTAGLIAANQFMPASATDLATAALVKQQAANAAAQGATQGATSLSAPGVIGAGRVPVEGITATGGSTPYFGSGGSLFNTEGMLGAQGSFAPLNVAGAALGGYGMYKASQMSNKRQGALSGAASGAMAGTSILPGWGTAIGAGLGAIAGLAANESTADRTKRRYGELQGMGDANFQAMANQGMQESLAGMDTWDIGDDKSQAPIDMMTRSYGVLKAIPEIANIDPSKRQEVVRKMVDEDLINSKQGEYLVDNKTRAKEIFDSVIKPKSPAQAAAQGAMRPKATTVR